MKNIFLFVLFITPLYISISIELMMKNIIYKRSII